MLRAEFEVRAERWVVVGYNRRWEFGVGICTGDCAQFYLHSFASFCFT